MSSYINIETISDIYKQYKKDQDILKFVSCLKMLI